MIAPSPLQETLQQYLIPYDTSTGEIIREGAAAGEYEAKLLSEFIPWGEDGCQVLGTAGSVELEYAAIKKTCGVFDASCRGTIMLRGSDRLDCVNRLTTQKVDTLKNGDSCVAFVTSRKGSIIADVLIHVMEGQVLLSVDITQVNELHDHINSYIVMEEVEVTNCTAKYHWLWCFGPEYYLDVNQQEEFLLPVDFIGIQGVAILLLKEQLVDKWTSIVEAGARPIGWYALNMARVEQRMPMSMIDFDSSYLPHETNLIQSRVRFDKGCYLGQEVVARIESLGTPKRKIVSLLFESEDLPVAGTQIWPDSTGSGTPVGIVTSSAISPLRGGVPIAIATIKKGHNALHETVFAYIGPTLHQAIIHDIGASETS